MTPSAPIILNGLARTALMELAPQAGGGFAAQTLQLMSALNMMLAQEWERAAARLVEENAALETLLGDARALVGEVDLGAGETSLLVSALQARNRVLRGLLVRVHAQVEELEGAAARAFEARIWGELRASTERRVLDMAMPS